MIRKHDYRVRRIRISERDVLDWFANAATQWTKAKCLSLPIIEGLPEDAYVESVHSSWESKSFFFIVHSETFSEFPAGSEIPELEGNFPCRYETIEIRTDEDRRREWAPQVWTYKALDGETKEAVLKAAMEQMDRTNILIPRPVQFSYGKSAKAIVLDHIGTEEWAIGEQVEWSPDLKQTWRRGEVVEIDLPNSWVKVREDGNWYQISIRDIRKNNSGGIPGTTGGPNDLMTPKDSSPSETVNEADEMMKFFKGK